MVLLNPEDWVILSGLTCCLKTTKFAILTVFIHTIPSKQVATAWKDAIIKMKNPAIALFFSVAIVSIFRGSGIDDSGLNPNGYLSMPLALADAVSNLAGFQSLVKLFLDNFDASYTLISMPEINLGTLDALDALALSYDDVTSEYSLEGDSTASVIDGTADDKVVAIAIEQSYNPDADRPVLRSVGSAVRSDGSLLLDIPADMTDPLVMSYMRGAGSFEGYLSPVLTVV